MGREEEGATFATERVGRRRDRPPLLALSFLGLFGALVLVGVGGRGPGPGTSVALGPASPRGGPVETDALGRPFVPSLPWDAAAIGSDPVAGEAPLVATTGGPIELKVRRSPASLFVHGDVFVPNVTWVFVTLLDARGVVAGWTSISVPGAAGPASEDAPNLRFDIDLAIPPEMTASVLSVGVSAYDADGGPPASTSLRLRPDGRQVDGSASTGGDSPFTAGARPGVFFPYLDASWEDRP